MIARLVVVALLVCSSQARADSRPCKAPVAKSDYPTCQAACDRKQYATCAVLGLAYINTGDEAELLRGIALLEKSCKGGAALGCGGMGSLYMSGIGVTRDSAKAVKLFAKACKQGDGMSCESLGGWYGGTSPE